MTITLQWGENGFWVAQIKEKPEVLSQGRTVRSALNNLADAYYVMQEEEDQHE